MILSLGMQDKSYLDRAFAAHYRTCAREGDGTGSPDMPSNESHHATVHGKDYVVLVNTNGILRVYRILTSGILKELKRWPKELEQY